MIILHNTNLFPHIIGWRFLHYRPPECLHGTSHMRAHIGSMINNQILRGDQTTRGGNFYTVDH